MPNNQIPARWKGDPDYYYEVYYLPNTGGELRLHIEIQSDIDGSWSICDMADVDVRHGGWLLITELHYNPPDIQPDDTATASDTASSWKDDGTLLEYVEIYNNGNADVSLLGLAFTSGIGFIFPNYVLPSRTYAIIAKDPTHSSWIGTAMSCHIVGICKDCTAYLLESGTRCIEITAMADCDDKRGRWVGYDGSLSNDGERLTLSALPYTEEAPAGNLTTVDSVYFGIQFRFKIMEFVFKIIEFVKF